MRRVDLILGPLIFTLLLYGCSINISQPSQSLAPPPSTIALPPSTQPVPLSSQSAPSPAPIGNKIPITWQGLGLSGKLIYVAGVVTNNQLLIELHSLDLATGEISTIFQAPLDGWIDAVEASPDHKTLIFSYAPPSNVKYGGQESLFLMPLDGSAPPKILFVPSSNQDQYYQPEWSPDGKFVYFTHINYAAPTTTYEIARMAYPQGKLEVLAHQAYWPSLSADGTRLAYVSIDVISGVNKLLISNADGSNAREIPLTGPWAKEIIDAPLFLPGNQSILFSAPSQIHSSLQARVAAHFSTDGRTLAHSAIPSDWFLVPLSGGRPLQLTHTQSYALFGSFSPDRKHIACYSADGLFVMNLDGTGLTELGSVTGGIPGTVSWLP